MNHAPAHSGELSVIAEGDIEVAVLIALLNCRQEVFATAFNPLDRSPEHPAHGGDHDLPRIHQMLAAETAAHVGCDDRT